MKPQIRQDRAFARGQHALRLAMVVAFCGAGSGFAVGEAGAMTAPAGAGTSLAITVTGHISPRCTLAATGGGASDLGDITDAKTGRAAAVSMDLPFSMTCNTPFVATLVSKNGGLAYDGSAEPQFASLVSYSASLGMGQIAGGVSLSCDSARMRAQGGDASTSDCRAASKETVQTVAGQGRVKVRLHPGAEPLLKGVYQDELVVRLSPVVSG